MQLQAHLCFVKISLPLENRCLSLLQRDKIIICFNSNKENQMKIKIVRSKSEFDSVRYLLHTAISEYETYQDEYLRIIVRDAKQLAVDRERYLYTVNRTVVRFSLELSKFDRRRLMAFDADNLQKNDYKEILKFFNR